MPYRACRQAGVIVLEHDAGTASDVRFVAETSGFAGMLNLGEMPKGLLKLIVGWTSSTCCVRSEGTEYSIVTMLSLPVSSCLKTLKSAAKISFALLMGMLNESQSPAGDAVLVVMSFSLKKAVTASTVSFVGATNAST